MAQTTAQTHPRIHVFTTRTSHPEKVMLAYPKRGGRLKDAPRLTRKRHTMAEPALPALLNSPASQTFPTLTPTQIARIAAHGSGVATEPVTIRGRRRVPRRDLHGGAALRRRVHVLVRSDGLAESMSRYLIRRIEDNPAIVLRTRTEITALEGSDHLERVSWRDDRTGEIETRDIRHVFVMTGATPSTSWLEGCVAVDAKGFIKTGPDLSKEELAAARWPRLRPSGAPRVGGKRRCPTEPALISK
jgi:hypothetical protein